MLVRGKEALGGEARVPAWGWAGFEACSQLRRL